MTPLIPREQLNQLCRLAADRLMRHPWKVWFWGDSIGLEGLLAAADVTGDEKYAAYAYGLLKGWIAREEPRCRFEHTAAGCALLDCARRFNDAALLAAAQRLADHLAGYRKTRSGCPVHYEDAHIELPPELPPSHPQYRAEREAIRAAMSVSDGGPCVFVDSVHFHGPFLAQLWKATREKRYLEQAVATIGPQVELVWDETERLFNHFWSERSGARNGVLWGRGNGWGMLGVIGTLEHLPDEHPLAAKFRTLIKHQAARLADLQDVSGDWHTILDDKGSYLETSVAAFVIDGFSRAIRRGWLSPGYETTLTRAATALFTHVRPDGLVDGVSYETFPSFRPEHYRTMPRGAMVPWGQGPFLCACRELIAL